MALPGQEASVSGPEAPWVTRCHRGPSQSPHRQTLLKAVFWLPTHRVGALPAQRLHGATVLAFSGVFRTTHGPVRRGPQESSTAWGVSPPQEPEAGGVLAPGPTQTCAAAVGGVRCRPSRDGSSSELCDPPPPGRHGATSFRGPGRRSGLPVSVPSLARPRASGSPFRQRAPGGPSPEPPEATREARAFLAGSSERSFHVTVPYGASCTPLHTFDSTAFSETRWGCPLVRGTEFALVAPAAPSRPVLHPVSSRPLPGARLRGATEAHTRLSPCAALDTLGGPTVSQSLEGNTSPSLRKRRVFLVPSASLTADRRGSSGSPPPPTPRPPPPSFASCAALISPPALPFSEPAFCCFHFCP